MRRSPLAVLVPLTVLAFLVSGFLIFTSPRSARASTGTKPTPLVIPEEEKKRVNPLPAVPEAILAGGNLYSSQCAMCHGIEGDGKGDLAQRLKLRIPDYTDPRIQKKRTDGELFYILTQGHGEMPAEKRLSEPNKWEIILYLRHLERPEKSK